MTRATRFVPSLVGVAPHTASNDGAERGVAASFESALTAKRKPWTEPSPGCADAGPWVAYVQVSPARSQNDQ